MCGWVLLLWFPFKHLTCMSAGFRPTLRVTKEIFECVCIRWAGDSTHPHPRLIPLMITLTHFVFLCLCMRSHVYMLVHTYTARQCESFINHFSKPDISLTVFTEPAIRSFDSYLSYYCIHLNQSYQSFHLGRGGGATAQYLSWIHLQLCRRSHSSSPPLTHSIHHSSQRLWALCGLTSLASGRRQVWLIRQVNVLLDEAVDSGFAPGSAVKPAATLIDCCQSNGLSLIRLAEQHLSRLHLSPAASTPCNEESASLDCECDCVYSINNCVSVCVYFACIRWLTRPGDKGVKLNSFLYCSKVKNCKEDQDNLSGSVFRRYMHSHTCTQIRWMLTPKANTAQEH